MKTYKENEKQLPVTGCADVLVCGGGPAGIGAALTAARIGASVILVEMLDCLGGMATAGMMSHWGGRSSSTIMPEIFNRTREKCALLGYDPENGCDINAIHHEAQKIVLEEMAAEAGIKILYYTKVCGAIVNEGVASGVIIENKSGRSVIYAKCIVDATGDGDAAAYAGVPYFKGREEDNKMQPCTLMFKIGGVDYKRAVFPPSFETLVHTDKGELQALAKEILPFPAGHVLLYKQPTPGTVCCNMTNDINIDGTDAESVAEGLKVCRSQIGPIIKFLKEYVPGYENCWLMSAGSMLGIRETRHFKGVKTLSAEDILNARQFDDWAVKRAFFNFDVHNLTGASLDKTGIQHEWKQNNDYTIPYGCLLPVNVDNLLLSGRNISGSHMAHSNFRIMSVCIALGEAAGAAAAISSAENISPKNVDVKKIQQTVGE